MAGYTVEQTNTGTETFPPHQQQREAIPSIKLGRIAGSCTAIPGHSVPMEVELGISVGAVTKPTDVIGSIPGNLPTASDSSTLTVNEHTSVMAQDRSEQMEDVPLTTTINLDKLISEFTASQQNELRTYLTNQEIQTVLNNAGILLRTLDDRKIELSKDRGKPPAQSLFSKLKAFKIVGDSLTFSGYFAKANVFFSAVSS